MKTIRQCEGCEYPLRDYEDAYARGEIYVEWFICEFHQPNYYNTLGFDDWDE